MERWVVEAHKITKSFGKQQVLRGVDLEVREGEIVGLVGLNGSGKSTLLKILAAVLAPDAGEAQSCGTPLDGTRSPFCGLMLENPPFIEEFSGRDNLWVLARLRKRVDEECVAATMREVGLDPYDRRAVRHYSQGMRQRLGLAQALMEHPPLLLLDEPLNGLDPTGIMDVRRLIQRSAKQGATVLFSSHVLPEVQKVCDRVLVMSGGVLVELAKQELSSAEALERAYRERTGYAYA